MLLLQIITNSSVISWFVKGEINCNILYTIDEKEYQKMTMKKFPVTIENDIKKNNQEVKNGSQ